jgi:GNAT superfamily N-acetyltransferase
VNKEHRGRGIGGRLLAALEARARQAGYKVLSEDEDGYLMLKRLGSSLL